MKITPIAADSLGVRSMATLVETVDARIFIDPSAALGPRRYGLPPAPQELDALRRFKHIIHEIALKCDILIITHYHYDHHDPHEDFYQGKIVYAKDRFKNINRSQRIRGYVFEENIKDMCSKLVYVDEKEIEIGKTLIKFSPPFPHGPPGTRLGYVLMVTIDDGHYRFLFSSDVQGPVDEEAAQYIVDENPDLLYMDGPPTLFLGWRFSMKNLEKVRENLSRILRETGCELILDHHLLRDLKYREHLSEIYDRYDPRTAAEYLGKPINMLEAHRKELWAQVVG
ncbi:MBL fold metallo-hydrolase [archaeon]|nr:MAG: MBL fold metallo-hydrolase [archaeon]